MDFAEHERRPDPLTNQFEISSQVPKQNQAYLDSTPIVDRVDIPWHKQLLGYGSQYSSHKQSPYAETHQPSQKALTQPSSTPTVDRVDTGYGSEYSS